MADGGFDFGTGPNSVPDPWLVTGGTLSTTRGIALPASVTGGALGPGTVNASVGFYVNGVLLGSVDTTLTVTAGVIGLNLAHANTWTAPQTIGVANAAAFAVGPNGNTNPALRVATSASGAATGLSVTSAAAGGGLAVATLSSGTNESLTINAKGSGAITIGNISSGQIGLSRSTQVSGSLSVGTAPDATNLLSVLTNATLFSAIPTGSGGSGNVQSKINKSATANTASTLFQNAGSSRAEVGLIGDNNYHVRTSPDGSTWLDSILIDNATGSTSIGSVDPYMAEKAIASASTTDIGAAITMKVAISGTTTITSFGTAAHRLRFLRFTGILTLTYNATSLILPGAANITTAVGDCAIATSDATGNWRIRNYQRAAGLTLAGGADTQIQFNSAGALNGSSNLVWDNVNNRLGIGCVPAYQSDSRQTMTSLSGAQAINNILLTANPAAPSAALFVGYNANVTYTSSSNLTGTIESGSFAATNSGTANINIIYGGVGGAIIIGTTAGATAAIGLYGQPENDTTLGLIGTGTGVLARSFSSCDSGAPAYTIAYGSNGIVWNHGSATIGTGYCHAAQLQMDVAGAAITTGAGVVVSTPLGVSGSYAFTVTAANATAGATYTNNAQTFTVVRTIAGATKLVTTGTGAPTASGTLTLASGTGDATIAFSAFSNTAIWGQIYGVRAFDQNPSGTGTNTKTNPPIAFECDSQTAAGAFAFRQAGAGINSFASGATFGAAIKLPSFTVATLPAAGTAGNHAYASNARMFTGLGVQEGAGAGTGGLVTDNGSAWRVAGTNSTAVA